MEFGDSFELSRSPKTSRHQKEPTRVEWGCSAVLSPYQINPWDVLLIVEFVKKIDHDHKGNILYS
jgi:hypothetical protein